MCSQPRSLDGMPIGGLIGESIAQLDQAAQATGMQSMLARRFGTNSHHANCEEEPPPTSNRIMAAMNNPYSPDSGSPFHVLLLDCQ